MEGRAPLHCRALGWDPTTMEDAPTLEMGLTDPVKHAWAGSPGRHRQLTPGGRISSSDLWCVGTQHL